MIKISNHNTMVNVDFKNNIFRFAHKQKGGLISILIDHNPKFKSGYGFEFYVEDKPATLTIIDHTTARLVINVKEGITEQQTIPISTSKDEWKAFIETDENKIKLSGYEKEKSYWEG